MSADSALTNCTGPGDTHSDCGSTIENFSLSYGDQTIASAEMLLAMSHSFASADGAFSHDVGSQMQGLCILQTAAAPCTSLPDVGVSAASAINSLAVNTAGVYPVDIPGIAVGTISVQLESPRTSDNGQSGSGLTVTMLHSELLTPDGWIILDVAQADSWAALPAATVTPTPSPELSPPPAPTSSAAPATGQPATLPSTGGPPAAGGDGFAWLAELVGIMLTLAGLAAAFSLRTKLRRGQERGGVTSTRE